MTRTINKLNQIGVPLKFAQQPKAMVFRRVRTAANSYAYASITPLYRRIRNDAVAMYGKDDKV